jgi:hypothetical protein
MMGVFLPNRSLNGADVVHANDFLDRLWASELLFLLHWFSRRFPSLRRFKSLHESNQAKRSIEVVTCAMSNHIQRVPRESKPGTARNLLDSGILEALGLLAPSQLETRKAIA